MVEVETVCTSPFVPRYAYPCERDERFSVPILASVELEVRNDP